MTGSSSANIRPIRFNRITIFLRLEPQERRLIEPLAAFLAGRAGHEMRSPRLDAHLATGGIRVRGT